MILDLLKKLFINKKDSDIIANNDMFIRLIEVANEDTDIKKKLVNILMLDEFNRKSALNTFIDNMRLKDAPKDFISAISYLLDDDIAKKALELLSNH